MRSLRTIAAAGFALILFSGAALADAVKFTADLGPDPQAKVKSNGKGSANLALDTASKMLSGSIEFSGLSATPAVAELEGPPPKEGAKPIEVPIPLSGTVASPINVSIKLTDAQIAGLKTGQWILLLGTKQAPEIGGDIKPAQ